MILFKFVPALLIFASASAFGADFDYAYLDRTIATAFAELPGAAEILVMEDSLGFTQVSSSYRMECSTCEFTSYYFCATSPEYAAIIIWQYPEEITFWEAAELAAAYTSDIIHCNRVLPGGAAPIFADSVCPAEAVPSPDWLPADVNYDCTVNIIDLIAVRNCTGKSPSETAYPRADFNRDGIIDIRDLLIIRDYLGQSCHSFPKIR